MIAVNNNHGHPPAFLDVWQGKDLQRRVSDVWQRKELVNRWIDESRLVARNAEGGPHPGGGNADIYQTKGVAGKGICKAMKTKGRQIGISG